MSWILPTISLSLYNTATFALWMRRYMVDELNKDYVRLAFHQRAPPFSAKVMRGSHRPIIRSPSSSPRMPRAA